MYIIQKSVNLYIGHISHNIGYLPYKYALHNLLGYT